ncbi:alpha/beta hydrolase [Actinomadura macrotermitis]|uniref:alpha/beta hydrolase n=1 Tax=Actinomadura macrotermitis TaxID=2585200 RepID=UPI002E261C37
MRKVLVCGAVFAATCITAVGMPAGALATTPEPTPSATPTDTDTGPVTPSPNGTPSPGDAPTPSPSTSSPDAEPRQATGNDSVTSASAVMVTPKPPSVRTYAYGKNTRQRLDVYWRQAAKGKSKTAKAKPRPAVLVLHGGYWLEGDKSDWRYFARRLTGQGFTVIAADYRLATAARWPAQRNDALAALRFVRKNAGRWNVDPGRIVVMGSSAGGMIATQLGTYRTGGDLVRGVVALSPVNTPYLAYQAGLRPGASPAQRKLRGAVSELLRCLPAADASCWERINDANSATHASAGDAPMLLLHSAGDFVPVTHSTGLATALRAAGVPVTVDTVPGRAHGNGLMNNERVYPQILAWLKARTR